MDNLFKDIEDSGKPELSSQDVAYSINIIGQYNTSQFPA